MLQFARMEFRGKELTILNRPRKFYHVHSLADFILADGRTVDARVHSCRPGNSTRSFSWEKPSRSDFDLWDKAITSLSSHNSSLLPQLGPYIAEPHIPIEWMSSNDEEFVYHLFPSGGYDTFQLAPHLAHTRSGRRYTKISTSPGIPPASKYASITNYSFNQVSLHSTCPSFQSSTTHNQSLLQSLISSSSSDLWSNIHIDDDGTWLLPSLLDGTLDICCDGSYMPDLSTNACSGAFILQCRESKKEIRGCFI
jgi:hypothetical protein